MITFYTRRKQRRAAGFSPFFNQTVTLSSSMVTSLEMESKDRYMRLSALYLSARKLVSRLDNALALRILLLFVKKDEWAPYPPRD
jgi:hypothetical protein